MILLGCLDSISLIRHAHDTERYAPCTLRSRATPYRDRMAELRGKEAAGRASEATARENRDENRKLLETGIVLFLGIHDKYTITNTHGKAKKPLQAMRNLLWTWSHEARVAMDQVYMWQIHRFTRGSALGQTRKTRQTIPGTQR